MNRILIFFLLWGISSCLPVWSQTYCTDSIGISTNPANAYNNESGQPVNTFDWMANPWYIDIYNSYSGEDSLQSPFHGNPGPANHYISNQDSSDFYPEDGWELVHWGMGKLVDGSNEVASGSLHKRNLPCVVLYNRHSGMLHIFGASDLDHSQIIQVELKFAEDAGYKSWPSAKPAAMLSYMNPVAQPLDQETTISRVTSRSHNPNDELHIFHAAFPIAYDPCVCQNEAVFQVVFRRIHRMDITAYGRIAATNESAGYYNGSGNPSFPDWLAGTHDDGNNNVLAGTQVHQTASNMYNAYQTEMQAANKPDVVSALGVLKSVLEFGAEVGGAIPIPGVASAFGIGETALKAIKYTTKALKISAKGVNFSQSILKLRKANEPAKPSKALPSIIRGEMTMSGTITDTLIEKYATEFAVPGSKYSWTYPEDNFRNQPYYPLYNEELGVLALLETPVLERHVALGNIEPCNGQLNCDREADEVAKYRLSGPIKYAINPAARIDVANSDISVAIIIERGVTPGTTPDGLGNLEESVDARVYISPFLPVNCMEDLTMYIDQVFQSFVGGIDYEVGVDQAYLRFANTYVSSTIGRDGLPVVSQQVVTFPVMVQDVASVPSSARMPFDLTLSGFVGSQPKAWRDITVVSTATFGVASMLTAGENVNVEPGVSIPAGVTLQIGLGGIFSCGAANDPYTPSQLNTYCQGNTYKGNQLSRLGQQYVANDMAAAERVRREQMAIELAAHPNPFQRSLTVRYKLPHPSSVSITIYDLMGRPVLPVQKNLSTQAGVHSLGIDTSPLAAGMYQVILQAGEQRQGVKVVKTE